MPEFIVGLDQRGALSDACVVNKNVGTTTERLVRSTEHRFYTLGVCDVTNESDSACSNLFSDCVNLLLCSC